MTDFLKGLLHRFPILLFHFIQDIARLVRPAALQGGLGINDLQGGVKACSPIGGDQLTGTPFFHPSLKNLL